MQYISPNVGTLPASPQDMYMNTGTRPGVAALQTYYSTQGQPQVVANPAMGGMAPPTPNRALGSGYPFITGNTAPNAALTPAQVAILQHIQGGAMNDPNIAAAQQQNAALQASLAQYANPGTPQPGNAMPPNTAQFSSPGTPQYVAPQLPQRPMAGYAGGGLPSGVRGLVGRFMQP